jgi:hypothetical protein
LFHDAWCCAVAGENKFTVLKNFTTINLLLSGSLILAHAQD